MPGPANLYGVSNSPSQCQAFGMGSDVVCTAGATTVVLSSAPLASVTAGWFYPLVWPGLIITIGATPPSSMIIGFRIGTGSMVDGWQIDGSTMPASGTLAFWGAMVGLASNVTWAGAGSVINLIVTPQTNNVTVRSFESRAVIGLFRAPDQ